MNDKDELINLAESGCFQAIPVSKRSSAQRDPTARKLMQTHQKRTPLCEEEFHYLELMPHPPQRFPYQPGDNLLVAFHYGGRTCHRNEFINVAKINGSTGNRWGRLFLIGCGKMPLIYIVLLGAGDTGSI